MKILFFGPYPKPFTGQSVAFKEIYDNFTSTKVLCDTTKFEDSKVLNSLYVFVILPFLFITKKITKVYFTCSRSKLGFIKDFYLIIFSQIFSVKLINHLHGGDFKMFSENSSYLFKKLIYWSYKKVDTSIVLTKEMVSQFNDYDTMKVEVVPNCYAKSFLDVTWSELQNTYKQSISLIYFSNIMSTKGIMTFLDALEPVLEKYPKITVDIAGVPIGDYLLDKNQITKVFKDKLKELKRKFGTRISYHGLVSGNLKETYLKKSSIFVLPTVHRSEAFPISIIEAMYFGNAIITTDLNYLPGIVKNKSNGILIKPNDSVGLEEALNVLLDDKEFLNAMQKTNYQDARVKYNPDKIFNSIDKIIRE